jgi:hypothetical protein
MGHPATARNQIIHTEVQGIRRSMLHGPLERPANSRLRQSGDDAIECHLDRE